MIGSKKMYEHSPKMERDGEGKMGVSKKPTEAEKTATAENGEVGGMPVHEKHAAERRELSAKHIKEHLDLHSKHEEEHAKMASGHANMTEKGE